MVDLWGYGTIEGAKHCQHQVSDTNNCSFQIKYVFLLCILILVVPQVERPFDSQRLVIWILPGEEFVCTSSYAKRCRYVKHRKAASYFCGTICVFLCVFFVGLVFQLWAFCCAKTKAKLIILQPQVLDNSLSDENKCIEHLHQRTL